MKVKQYRAATMREALEQVKDELGDEALVLSSKNVRDGGFLGFGAKNAVEVTVSTDVTNTKVSASDENKRTPRQSTLGLQDSELSQQITQPATERTAGSAFSALAARAYSAEASAVISRAAEVSGSTAIVLERAKAREAEARDASRKALLNEAQSAPGKFESPAPVTAKRDPLVMELDRLRAEIREVKFAVGTFASHRRDTPDSRSQPILSEADLEIYDSPFYETYLHLGALGLPPELANAATRAAHAAGSNSKEILELAQIGMIAVLPSLIKFGTDPLVRAKNSNGSHPVLALVGPTGVGKTTTIAKLAARVALREQRRVELITLDTYRIAAVEQLRTYAEIIGAGFHVAHTIPELDALVRRLSNEATVMIDTIGRSAQDLADQMKLADYLRGNELIAKALVIQATTHPADAQLAISKFSLFGINSLVITKLDETCRAGAAIAIAAEAGVPLAYLCNGQRVPEDIETATPRSLTACVLRTDAFALAA